MAYLMVKHVNKELWIVCFLILIVTVMNQKLIVQVSVEEEISMDPLENVIMSKIKMVFGVHLSIFLIVILVM